MAKLIINGKSDTALKAYMDGQEVNSVMAGGVPAYTRMTAEEEPAPPTPTGPDYLCFTANTGGSTIRMQEFGATGFTPLIYVSTDDKQTWTQWDLSAITLANAGDKVYMKGTNDRLAAHGSADWEFNMTGSIAASGDLTTLLDENGTDTLAYQFTFSYLFYDCTSLTTAPDLPATTLAASCYASMFRGCTSLTTAPELPATTLAGSCYQAMFMGCHSLSSVKIAAMQWDTVDGSYWLNGTANVGVIYAPTGSDIANYRDNFSGVPFGWTVQYY